MVERFRFEPVLEKTHRMELLKGHRRRGKKFEAL
jgi:hypothetical protein